MFKNLMIYRIDSWPISLLGLESALYAAKFTTCGASQEKSVGWVPPRGHAHGALAEVVGGQWILKFRIETKVLPVSVVKRKVAEMVEKIDVTEGRKVGRNERKELTEEARQQLLPRAFTKVKDVQVWVEPWENLLCTDAGSAALAGEMMFLLHRASIVVAPLSTQTSPAAAMAHWLATKEAPHGFTVDRECELKAPDESKSVVRYSRHALDTNEVVGYVEGGLQPTLVALTWRDRVSFVLTDGLQLKKIEFLDSVFIDGQSDNEDKFDADVEIFTGEMRDLIVDLVDALGGEK
jgi:recombination associated protein RdgC